MVPPRARNESQENKAHARYIGRSGGGGCNSLCKKLLKVLDYCMVFSQVGERLIRSILLARGALAKQPELVVVDSKDASSWQRVQ
jgi:hypothetical protein